MIEFFDTAEEMFEAIRRNEEAAEAAVEEWQKRIKVGDCVMRFDPAMGIWIFTEILDPIEGERKLCDMSDPGDQQHMAELEEMWKPGGFKRCRRWGKHYSVACPSGELGELHIAAVTAIVPRHVFNLAIASESPEMARNGHVLFQVFLADICRESHNFVRR